MTQNAWALDLSLSALAGELQSTEEASRPAGASADSLQIAETQKLDLISQKQTLESLSATQNIGAFQVLPALETPAPIDAAMTPISATEDSSDTEDSLDEGFDYVQFFEDARIAGTFSPTNDPYFSNLGWLQMVNADDAWELTRGAGITIAVLDTGIDLNHPDLIQNIWANLAELNGQTGVDDDSNGYVDDIRGWDFNGNDNQAADLNGHGTHVAGIIGALRNNSIGIAGMAPEAKIIPVQVLDSDGGGFWPDVLQAIINGIKYAADLGADVINLSLGIPNSLFTASQTADFIAAIDYARARNAIVVVAAGNEASNIDTVYPASFTNVFTVGSVGTSVVSSFSNFGNGIDLVAPGQNVLSTYFGADYAYGSGTSMSTAVVSGAVALALSINPLLSFADLQRIFTYGSTDLGAWGYDETYGNGRIDALNLVTYDYFDSGRLKLERYTDGRIDYFYDYAPFTQRGPLSKSVAADGSYVIYEEYFVETFNTSNPVARFQRSYTAANALLETREYNDSGNLIQVNDALNRVVRNIPPGYMYALHEYYGTTNQLSKSAYYIYNGLDKTVEFYSSGNEKSQILANGSGYTRYDENFYGNKTGRLSKTILTDLSYKTYDEYWPGTATVKTEKIYNAAGVLQTTNNYDINGNLIPPGSGGTPVLAFSINAQNYASVSGSVLNYPDNVLGMYGNRTINYALNITEGTGYALKLSTAQITSKTVPAGYLFHLNILVDGVLKISVDLNSSKTFAASNFIPLGALTVGAHTVGIQWTNDTNVSPDDSNLGIKDIQVFKTSTTPSPTCDAVSCLFDGQNRITRSNYSDGTYALHEYFTSTTQRSKSTHYTSANVLIKTVEFYSSGNEKSQILANGSGYTRYDENFYGNKTGRLSKTILTDLSYKTYDEYWPGTATVKTEKIYNAAGVLQTTNNYDINGNLIPPGSGGTPVLAFSINAQSYSSVSGSVINNADGSLGMYSNRTITYGLNITEATTYSLKLSTAQFTSKTVPAGYLFHVNIFVDGVLVSSADLNSSKTFTASNFINLGNLSTGAHTFSIQWTNDTNASPNDSNLAIKDLQVFKVSAGTPTCDAVSCLFDGQNRITRSNFSDGTYALHEYYGTTEQRSKSTHYTSANALIKTVEFYSSGNEKSLANADGSGYTRLDENFFGNKTGRLSRTTLAGGAYTTFENYYGSTNVARFQKDYSSTGVLLATREYDSAGNLIPPGGTPVLTHSINAHNYSSASGSVLLNSGNVLGMYSNRTINYALNIAEAGDYSFKLSAGQISSKNAPAGYLFRLNIRIDGVIVAAVDLSSSKTFVISDYIDLGTLSVGSHTLGIQWINDAQTATEDANFGFKDLQVFKNSGAPPVLPCDAVSCSRDAQNRIIRSNFSDGTYALHEYYGTTEQRSKSTYYTSTNTLTHTVEFYQSGNEKSNIDQSGSGYIRYDENFYGNKKGRLLRMTQADGSYQSFDEYWPGTATVKTERLYSSSGVLIDIKRYDEIGNRVPPPSTGGEPVLLSAINAQSYGAYQGEQPHNYPDGVLGMNVNGATAYPLNLTTSGKYVFRLSAAQITTDSAPPGYLFHLNIMIDWVTVATVDMSSSKTFAVSDYIDLGNLEAGTHTLTVQWTNDSAPAGYNSNLGFKDLEVYVLL